MRLHSVPRLRSGGTALEYSFYNFAVELPLAGHARKRLNYLLIGPIACFVFDSSSLSYSSAFYFASNSVSTSQPTTVKSHTAWQEGLIIVTKDCTLKRHTTFLFFSLSRNRVIFLLHRLALRIGTFHAHYSFHKVPCRTIMIPQV